MRRPRLTSRPLRLALLATSLLAACKDTSQAPTSVIPSIAVLSGGNASDTIEATLAAPVVLQYTDARGAHPAGITVSVTMRTRGDFPPRPELQCRRSANELWQISLEATTEADGRITLQCRLGPFIGTLPLSVSAPPAALRVVTTFTAAAGKPARLITPDTTIFVGDTFLPGVRVVDRLGNFRDDPVTLVAGAHVAIDGGTSVRATSEGRGIALARVGSLEDTVRVSIPPPVTIAALLTHPYGRLLTIARIDGANKRFVAATGDDAGFPAWLPGTTSIVYQDRPFTFQRSLMLYSDSGGRRLRVIPPGEDDGAPSPSPDGAWLYFTHDVTTESAQLWRMRPDGSGAQRILIPGYEDWQFYTPSVAPDGRRLVVRAWGGANPQARLCIIDLVAGTLQRLPIDGAAPTWSPTGDLIAFATDDPNVGRSPMVVRPDGTGLRSIAPAGREFYARGSWTSDGRWLVYPGAFSEGKLHVLSAQAVEWLPVRWAIDVPALAVK